MHYTIKKLPNAVLEIDIEVENKSKEKMGEKIREQAIINAFAEIIAKEKISVLTTPQISVLEEDPLHFQITFTTMPELKVPTYKKIKIEKQKMPPITEKEIDFVIEELCRTLGKKIPSPGDVRENTIVTIDYEARDENDIVQMAEKKKTFYIGTKSTLIADFQKNLIGGKTGEKRQFTITLPKNYFKQALQNKKLTFTVNIIAIYTLELPEVNDFLAQKVLGENKTVKDLREAVKSDLKKQRTKKEKRTQENQIMEYIIEHTEGKIPPALIEDELAYLVELMYQNAEKEGFSKEAYDTFLKKEKRDPRKQLQAQAKKNVTFRLALEHLFQSTPELSVTDEEIIAQVEIEVLKVPSEKRETLREGLLKDATEREQIKRKLQLQKLFANIVG